MLGKVRVTDLVSVGELRLEVVLLPKWVAALVALLLSVLLLRLVLVWVSEFLLSLGLWPLLLSVLVALWLELVCYWQHFLRLVRR